MTKPLLMVSEVAKRLNGCAATVYKLCASRALLHVRVLNAIRVSVRRFKRSSPANNGTHEVGTAGDSAGMQ